MGHTGEPDKKRIKRQRVCSYFVTAAKEIIHTEGVENVTVRRVADSAGYAFSTIYKHYKDLDALLLDVKADMIRDIVKYMQDHGPAGLTGIEELKTLNRTYAEYYIDRPHIFRFFYSYRLQPDLPPVELPDFSTMWMSAYGSFVESGIFHESEIPQMAKSVIYALHGLLTLYFAGYGMTREMFFEELELVTEFILGGRHI